MATILGLNLVGKDQASAAMRTVAGSIANVEKTSASATGAMKALTGATKAQADAVRLDEAALKALGAYQDKAGRWRGADAKFLSKDQMSGKAPVVKMPAAMAPNANTPTPSFAGGAGNAQQMRAVAAPMGMRAIAAPAGGFRAEAQKIRPLTRAEMNIPIDNALPGLAKLSALADKATGSVSRFFKEGFTAENIERAGGILKGVAVGLAGLGAGIGYGLNQAAGASAHFSRGIAEISTLVPEAQFATKDMRKEIFAMMDQFGGDSDDQIRAVYQGISAGADNASKSVSLMTAANKLAVGGATDVRTAVDGLTNVLNAYGKAYTDQNLAGLSDQLFIAVAKGKTTIAELSAGLGQVAPSANAAGISMGDLIASISAITTKGISTEQAITGMKAALAVVSHPAKEAADEAARMGIKFNEAAIRAQGLPKFLDSITKNGKFTADTMSKLFGGSIEAKNAIIALAGAGNGYADVLDAMSKGTGAADEAFRKMSENPEFQGALFDSLIKKSAILVGDVIAPIKGALLRVGAALLQTFGKIPAPIQKMIVLGIAAAGAFATIAAGAIGLAAAIGGIIAIGTPVLIALGGIVAIMAPLIVGIALVTAAGIAFKAAWDANVGGIATVAIGWFNKIKLAFEALGQLFSDGYLSGEVQTEFDKAENKGIKSFVTTLWTWFGRIGNFFDELSKGFSAGLAPLQGVFHEIMVGLEKVLGNFMPLGDSASTSKDKFEEFGRIGKSVGTKLAEAVGWIAKKVLWVIEVANKVIPIFLRVGGAIMGYVGGAIKTVSVYMGSLYESIGEIVGSFADLFGVASSDGGNTASIFEILGAVLGVVADIVGGVLKAAFGVLAATFQTIAGVVGAVSVIIQTLIADARIMADLFVKLLSGDLKGAWIDFKNFVETTVDGIVQAILKMVAGVAGAIDRLAQLAGKDLGLKAKVQMFAASDGAQAGIGKSQIAMPTAPPVAPVAASTAGPVTPLNSASTAAQFASAQNPVNIVPAAPLPKGPETVNLKSQLVIDGAVLAEANQNAMRANAGRAFEPVPSAP